MSCSMEQLVGQALAHMEVVEKATNEVDAKQNASAQLLQSLITQMQEFRADNQGLRARIDEIERQPKVQSVTQELRAENQALRARIDELERRPKVGTSGGSSRPATLGEIMERRNALREIKEAGINLLMARAAGYSLPEMMQAGYVEGLMQASYSIAEVRLAGYSIAEAKRAGYVAGLKQAGYTTAEVKQAGYTCAEVKQAGYTCAEVKQAGYTCEEAKQAGYAHIVWLHS